MKKLTINSKIRELLLESKIPIEEGISYLILVYYGLNPSFISQEFKIKVNSCGIFTKDYSSGVIKWNISVFEEQATSFEWVYEWRKRFKRGGINRMGDRGATLTNMKKFFTNNPHVRKDDVEKATDLYFKELNDYTYMKKAHKFIYEGAGTYRTSILSEFVERLEDNNTSEGGNVTYESI